MKILLDVAIGSNKLSAKPVHPIGGGIYKIHRPMTHLSYEAAAAEKVF
jgi:hypothetical protein